MGGQKCTVHRCQNTGPQCSWSTRTLQRFPAFDSTAMESWVKINRRVTDVNLHLWRNTEKEKYPKLPSPIYIQAGCLQGGDEKLMAEKDTP